MRTARQLVTRALQLINVPGRGSDLDDADLTAGFETLQELLDSSAVSRAFQPGIARHFFPLTLNKAIYTYGPGGELDSQLYFDQPAAISLEDAYIRGSGQILDNEQVTDSRFGSAAGWTLGTGWSIANNLASLAAGNSGETLDQALALEADTDYVVKVTVDQVDSTITVDITSGTALLNVSLDSSGTYEYEIRPSVAGGTLTVTADDADSAFDISHISIVEKGKSLSELQEDTGYDYPLRMSDQKSYNSFAAKGSGGRPDRILFSRSYPLAEIRFDTAPLSGDILVMDVRVNLAQVTDVNDTLKLNPEAMKWLRYQLANELAGEYGKELSMNQLRIMDRAYEDMAAANTRKNRLKVDAGLRTGRGRYNINRGDN